MLMGSRCDTRFAKSVLLLVVLGAGSSPAYAKRAPPKEVPPVRQNGVEYSAAYWAVDCGFMSAEGQPGGYVQAKDKSGKLLWDLRVYEVKYDCNIETDVQDLFITSLKMIDGKLQVVNEEGDKFVVDLSNRKVIQGADRVYRFDERSDQRPPNDETRREGEDPSGALLPLLVTAALFALLMCFRRRTSS
jgi:hypothetical protein